MIRVRRADLDDEEAIEHLIALQQATFDYVYHGRERILESIWWLAWDECHDLPVGFCGTTYYPERCSAFLCLSGVVPAFRGRGLQRRFVRVRERAAVRDGYHRMISYTTTDNVWSANNLIRCGYKMYVPQFQWGVQGAAYFEKQV
jgi:GNAT superfamily N-acetyltransferase